MKSSGWLVGENTQLLRESFQPIILLTLLKGILPVDVGPQGHGLGLHLLHTTEQNTRV